MMILPDRRIPKTRLLMPVPNFQWKAPSQARQKDQFGKEDRTYFALTGRLNDGHIMWRGVFEDRNDADAFLFSMVTGSLLHEPALWRLPTPSWNPALGENVSYQFATITVLTAGAGTIQTYTLPVDWDSTNNNVQCWAGGAGGARGTPGNAGRGGGGGGAFSRRYNINLTTNASYLIGSAGLGATSLSSPGGNGGPTWFVGTDLPSSTVGADGGLGGVVATGGSGGLASNCTGTTNFNGGTAGNGQAGNGAGGGGGGAAGSGDVGGNGTNGASGNGGNGGNGGISDTAVAGGIGATASSGTGGNGNQYAGGYGSGGGGGGGSGSPSIGGAGGTYGAGGGGGGTSSSSSSRGGDGTQGFMIITYEPYVPRGGYNLAMMGM